MKHRLLTAVALAAFIGTTPMNAGAELSVNEVRNEYLPVTMSVNNHRSASPAMMFYRDSLSLSTVSISGSWMRRDKSIIEQLGSGHAVMEASAASFMRLGSNAAVWGEASFATGLLKDIRWADCIDYMRVAPYVLGDEVGGDMNDRRYCFSGGYSEAYGRWTFGIEAAYRAEIAYRNRDPRVKDIVSDLDIAGGASIRIGSTYAVGINAAINVYSQNCDLDFYNPVNDINTLTLTGLGTVYKRFQGNANKNSGYESTGYVFGMQFQPTGTKGVFADASYRYYRMDLHLRDFNNLTLGFTDNDIFKVAMSYVTSLSRSLTFAPRLSASIFRRKGTENLFGTSSGAAYDKIGSRTPYSHCIYRLSLEVPAQLSFGKTMATLSPEISFEKNREIYADPLREISVNRLTPGLKLSVSAIPSRVWIIEGETGGRYSAASTDRLCLDELDITEPLGASVAANAGMLQSDIFSAYVKAKISRHIRSGVILSLSAGYDYTDYINEGSGHGISMSFGAIF